MGRSVSTPASAIAVIHLDVSEYDSDTWEDFLQDVRNVVEERFPSLTEEDGWLGREDRIVAGNTHAVVTVSEYCGVAAVALCPREIKYGSWVANPLGVAWVNQVARKFEEHFAKRYPQSCLSPIGTASNGCTFYRHPADSGSLGMGIVAERGEHL